jgi:hypothetical protein
VKEKKSKFWSFCVIVLVLGVFLDSAYRETPKSGLGNKNKNYLGLVGFSKANQIYVGVRLFFLSAPCLCAAAPARGTSWGSEAGCRKEFTFSTNEHCVLCFIVRP